MERVYNFSPGPSMLPLEALETAAKELVCYGSSGTSVMEMSHRSKAYIEIFDAAVALIKELMNVPDNYKILLMQGGATAQFAVTAMNLMTGSGRADYVDSGSFAHGALVEAKKYGKVNIVASSRDENYTYIPELNQAAFDKEADYFHITTNNTIFGTRYTALPDTGKVPLAADMSSNILSEVYDVSKFGVIYAGAQKNIGPAGVTVVIVREDLMGREMPITPKFLSWKLQSDNDSMLNTPATYSAYMAKLCLEWLKKLGGVPAMEQLNIAKAAILYDFLDESKLFKGTAKKEFRSRMNATFVTGSEDLDDQFVKGAAKAGLVNLKGHRSVGGMRASIYNAMPVEGVKALVAYMKQFEGAH